MKTSKWENIFKTIGENENLVAIIKGNEKTLAVNKSLNGETV